MPNVDIELDATFDKDKGPYMLLWAIAKQFSRLSAEYGQNRAEFYLEKALEKLVKRDLDKFSAELLDDYNGAAKWLGVLESGDPLEGAARAMNDKLCEAESEVGECIKMVERATNRADGLAVDAAILETALVRIQGMASEDLWADRFGGAISTGNLCQIEAYARGALAALAISVSELGKK